MDIDIAKLKDLIAKREDIDAQIIEACNGTKERKTQRCSRCGEAGHSVRTCSKVE